MPIREGTTAYQEAYQRPDEIKALLSELEDPFRTMVFLAAPTGLRVSELLALKWHDISFEAQEIRLSRAIVDGVVGGMKTEASRKPIPLPSALAEVLMDWRSRSPYPRNEDWVFASPEKSGQLPYWPDSALRRAVRLPQSELRSASTSAGTRSAIRSQPS